MAEHHPGPWKWTDTTDDGYVVYSGDDENDSQRGKDVLFAGLIDREADARLIAAAPDLLAALKIADVHVGWDDCSLKNVHDIIRAAIRKAEGVSNG